MQQSALRPQVSFRDSRQLAVEDPPAKVKMPESAPSDTVSVPDSRAQQQSPRRAPEQPAAAADPSPPQPSSSSAVSAATASSAICIEFPEGLNDELRRRGTDNVKVVVPQ